MPLRYVEAMQDNLAFKITDATVAAGAMTYPLWRAALHDWSEISADLVPIAGLAWLGVQIGCRLWVTAKAKKDA